MLKHKYLLFFIVVLLINSCTSIQKKSFVNSFNFFVSDVEANYKSYNEKEWEEADLKFENLIKVEYVKYQSSLTDAENSQINTLIGKYQAIKLKSSLLGIKNQFQNIIEQGTSFVNELELDTTLLK
jgi:hypothetical protein